MQRASERAVASFANHAHTILRRLSFSTDRSYKLLGRQLWAVLSSEKSRSPTKAIKVSKSRHNSRIKLRMELSNDQKRDNTESYLRCKFQCSPFSVRCKTDITDGKIAPQVLMPRGIHAVTCSYLLANCIGIINNAMLSAVCS